MEDINLYDLTFAFTRRPEVTDANVATGMCPDDTVLVEFTNGQVAVFNVQDGYPAVTLGTLYAAPTASGSMTRWSPSTTTSATTRIMGMAWTTSSPSVPRLWGGERCERRHHTFRP